MAMKTYTTTGYMNNSSLLWEHGELMGPLPIYHSIEAYTRDNPDWASQDGSTAPIKVTMSYEYDNEAAMQEIINWVQNNPSK